MRLCDTVPPADRKKIKSRFYKILTSGSAGTFALID
jgi:hypothetical protein